MKKILCLDFDGVICDSIQECLLTSYIAYQIFINGDTVVDRNIKIPQNIKNNFSQYRYLVQPAKQYGMLMHMLHYKESISADEFAKSCNDYSFPMNEYESLFFQVRAELISSDLSYWLNMNVVYPHVLKHWSSITKQISTYIVTNKNYNSVRIILDYFKLDFNKDNIISKERTGSKAETLIALAKHHKIEHENVIFIDDNSQYILEILDLGIKAYLANWGYEKYIKKSDVIEGKYLINEFGDIAQIINEND
jgi:phosphoglycolate phosphatase-like HAD superfamily hydrolase